MDIEMLENVISLIAVMIAMLSCLFRYIDKPRKGYLILSVYFLAHLLSDYYWTVYSLVMGDWPDISEFIAYFGWNIAYAAMFFVVFRTGDKKAKRYFHPVMLIPIPLNIYQFMLYIQFGGIFNNLWSGIFLTATTVICIQSCLFYLKNRSEGVHFPFLHTFILMHVITSYGMWTASCFDWPSTFANPYYWFQFANSAITILLPWAAGRDHAAEGIASPEKSSEEIRFQVRIQAAVSMIILGVCAGGYYMAMWMKNTLPGTAEDPGVYNIIAVTLFVISIFLSLFILVALYIVAIRYRTTKEEGEKEKNADERRNKFNLVMTLLVTLGLMIFSGIYNSRLYFNVASSRILETGEDKAETTAAELQNYLYLAEATLKVTADTVDIMVANGEDPKKIEQYIVDETGNQKTEFDENFTGIYAYINGEYMDGLGWVPPEGYDPTKRSWYTDAVEGDGKVVLVAPYVDAQTGSVVITICKLIKNGTNENGCGVVALDVIVNHIQEVTQEVDIGGKGYAMVVDDDGMIISHRDPSFVGKNLKEELGGELFGDIIDKDSRRINTVINGEESTVFASTVMDQWHVLIVVGETELMEDTRSQLVVNIAVSVVIFALISFFYFLGYKNEQVYGKKMEEMKVGRQKQEYEAKVLRLEKHAADEANKAKSNFLADMSHEIRTPINAIIGMNEMIMRETGEQEVLEYAKNIKTSGATLLELINSILDFSKIEDGKMEIVPVKYSLASVITYLVNSINDRAAAKGLALDVKVSPNLPSELFGDDMRIRQVVVNLLTNAVKYTKEGTVTLTVDEKERTDDTILLYVEVKDTGIGIREEDMEKLFQSFERLDVVKNRNIEGTGLGISIVTNLLNLMDSELKVESTYGKGSVFSFELWQKIENAEPVGDYRIEEEKDATLHAYRESFTAPDARILVVDDTKMNIIVVENLLKNTGIKIDTAMSGPEAIRLSTKNRYDVILLDQRMPGMDGTETLAKIRSSEQTKNPDTPVICLTADAIRGARERYMAEGFDDYLTKPVEGRELERLLAQYIIPEKMIKNTVSIPPAQMKAAGRNELVSLLERQGFDTDKALSYCGGDTDIYISVLSEFSKEYVRKSGKLRLYFDRKAWHDYGILIHSVKSSARTIGATKLSDISGILEKAANEEDTAVIDREHPGAMRMYDEVADIIRKNIHTDDGDAADDGDILEFEPGT